MPWIMNVGEAAAEQVDPSPDTVVISITEPKRRARLKPGWTGFQDYQEEHKHPDTEGKK